MYPTIYDAVKDLFGISIPFLKLLQSFGFFVAISFLISAWVFAKELARKEKAKKDFLDSRVKPIPPDLASLNEAQLVSLCKDIHAQITTAEEERYTAEMKIRKTDYDVCIIL